jgi:hypothetical protein
VWYCWTTKPVVVSPDAREPVSVNVSWVCLNASKVPLPSVQEAGNAVVREGDRRAAGRAD